MSNIETVLQWNLINPQGPWKRQDSRNQREDNIKEAEVATVH